MRPPRRPSPGTLLACGVALLLALGVLLERALLRELIHDEHQFVAPAALLSQHGQLPYVDYPYFHMPYLVFLYAGVFQLTDHLLLGARLFSVACSFGLVLILFQRGWKALDRSGPVLRLAFATGGVGLLLFSPTFAQGDGLSWNHNGGTLCALLAFLFLCRALRGARARRDAFFTGVFLALATGIRLSFAPLAIPFGLMLLLGKTRPGGAGPWSRVGWLASGGVVASLPIIALMVAAPDSFFFGNLGYPELNTAWYASLGTTNTMTWGSKLVFFIERILLTPGTLVLALLFGLSLLGRGIFQRRLAGGRGLEVFAVLICMPFLLLGAMLPTPTWPQYYFACVPFLVLGTLHGMALLCVDPRRARPALMVVACCAVAAVLPLDLAQRPFADVGRLFSPADWEPVKVHRVGLELADRVHGGLVFTEAPIYALEGKSSIYPFHATGPFTWRTGHLLSEQERAALGIKIPRDLYGILTETPPDAVLTGPDGWLSPLTSIYADMRELERTPLANDFILFASP
jgi:hypothetical protein